MPRFNHHLYCGHCRRQVLYLTETNPPQLLCVCGKTSMIVVRTRDLLAESVKRARLHAEAEKVEKEARNYESYDEYEERTFSM